MTNSTIKINNKKASAGEVDYFLSDLLNRDVELVVVIQRIPLELVEFKTKHEGVLISP